MVGFYGEKQELMIGGYNQDLFNKSDLFWLNTIADDWNVNISRIGFDHVETIKSGLTARLLLEYKKRVISKK